MFHKLRRQSLGEVHLLGLVGFGGSSTSLLGWDVGELGITRAGSDFLGKSAAPFVAPRLQKGLIEVSHQSWLC